MEYPFFSIGPWERNVVGFEPGSRCVPIASGTQKNLIFNNGPVRFVIISVDADGERTVSRLISDYLYCVRTRHVYGNLCSLELGLA